ncbi:Serine/threonine-protein kinase CTR1 [Ectocarpus siliculosus]|uniref:Serine/threonine-protein kinase CTR1 n=1 Tax=Ectocarpus siliculosus TaxID=2880 RepID=D8LLC2_ECTSI|nr:Serine/threonine-protein kinase CTR1 [Ectocarpus siliculosus]|eukprot:CBN77120.1 Serine/threonine-protein kinase CTR1 [Ectocarpus siliculosus]
MRTGILNIEPAGERSDSVSERPSGGGDTRAQEERIPAPTSTHPASSAPPPTTRTGPVNGRTTTTTTTAGSVQVEDDIGAPEILKSRKTTTTKKRTETKTAAAAAAATTSAARGRGPALKAPGAEREIASLPVVELGSMKFIAHGAFCAVFACKYRGFSVVAKRVREDLPLPERRKALENLWQEYDCLQPLQHPNVIEAYGMCRVRCREGYDDWNERDVCLLLEQLAFGTVGHLFGTTYSVEKNLKTAMARSRKMKMVPFRCRLHRALELAQALEYVHGGSGIGSMMHRDIKSMNVGFAQNGCLKLLDFGLSKMVPLDSTEDDTYEMTGEVGSYRYMAPELVKHEPYNVKVDVYSWAILSWEILAIDRPYADMNQASFINEVSGSAEANRRCPEVYLMS